VRFDIKNADFATAMQAASEVTMSFSVALDSTIIFSSPIHKKITVSSITWACVPFTSPATRSSGVARGDELAADNL
jgi:hypothetical protein